MWEAGLAPTYNKQLSETPLWSATGRVVYRPFDALSLGASAKYVGKRFQTEDNNAWVPDYYTLNVDIEYRLDGFGLPNSLIRFNADNILDKHYFGSVGTQTCWTPVNGQQTNGCTTMPFAYEGAPRTFQVSLVARY